MNTVLGPL